MDEDLSPIRVFTVVGWSSYSKPLCEAIWPFQRSFELGDLHDTHGLALFLHLGPGIVEDPSQEVTLVYPTTLRNLPRKDEPYHHTCRYFQWRDKLYAEVTTFDPYQRTGRFNLTSQQLQAHENRHQLLAPIVPTITQLTVLLRQVKQRKAKRNIACYLSHPLELGSLP